VVAALPGAEPRAGQDEMCEAVAHALESGRHLLVEAPTGTGKSLAYAVAAAMHTSGKDDARVLVTTATKALQEQLCDEDLPHAQKALEELGISFSFTLLKGRANYLCSAKLDEVAADAPLQELFATTKKEKARGDTITRVREWAEATTTGDIAELDDVPDEIWDGLTTSSRECPGAPNCAAGDRCFAEMARAKAHNSDIVVVNTALYGSNIAAGGFILPEHDAVVIDEAHLCEDVFADQFGVDIHAGRLRNLAALAQPFADRAVLDRMRRTGDLLEVLCAEFADKEDARVLAYEGKLAEVLASIRTAVVECNRAVKDAKTEPGSAASNRRSRTQKAGQTLDNEIGMLLDEDRYETHVAWCEAEKSGPSRLIMMPVVVAERLARGLFPNVTVIATSATLAIGGRFDDVAIRFGLTGVEDADEHEWDGLAVASPFDFRQQALLYVPKHLPDRRDPRFDEAMAEELHSLISAAGGRTLALFTSWRAMQDAAERCAKRDEYMVLRQGEATRRTLVDALKDRAETGGVAVFATMGFWTGVDIAGLGLSLVTIDRLPFPRPNEPLHAARRARAEQAGRDSFQAVDVPRAAMLLAQGAGRLVRHREDHGVVAVLDRRLATARYRDVLLATMPPFKRTINGEEVRAFLREITKSG
jgi:ATP-dependent DNA helicase DinG